MNRKSFNAQLAQYATPTVTGEGSVMCQDGIKCYLPGLQVDGNTLQQTYKGYNLLDYADRVLNFDGSTQVVKALYPNYILSPSTTYTLSFDYEFSNLNGTPSFDIGRGEGWYTIDIKQAIRYPNTTKGTFTYTFSIPSNLDTRSNLYFRIRRESAEQNYTVSMSNWQLVIGSEVKPYEPYVGGIPSPNPGAPIKRIYETDLVIPDEYVDNFPLLMGATPITLLSGSNYKLTPVSVATGYTIVVFTSLDDNGQFLMSTEGEIYDVTVPNVFYIGIAYPSGSQDTSSDDVWSILKDLTITATSVNTVTVGVTKAYPQPIENAGYGSVSVPLLPTEYQQVEYIESTGAQYIDSGFTPNQDTKVYAKFQLTKTGANYPFGVRETSQKNICYISGGTPSWNFRFGAASSFSYGTTDTELHEIEMSKNGIFWDDTNLNAAMNASKFTATGNLYICAMNNNGSVSYGRTYIYNLKLYDNDILIRDFIPCYRKSDSVVGLYDVVNNVFYENQGTGEFLNGNDYNQMVIQNTGDKGIDVKLSTPILPNEYQEVEYIESTGTQYIDTGIIPSVESTKKQTGIEVTYQYTNLTSSFVFGSRTGVGTGDSYYHNRGSGGNFGLYIVNGGGSVAQDDTNKHTITVKSNRTVGSNRTVEYDGQEVDFSYNNFTGTYSVYLFACNQAGSAYLPSQIKLYSCKMTDIDGNLVRDYIPCYRKTDGAIGLYDIVNNEFKTNQGTGAFRKGKDTISRLSVITTVNIPSEVTLTDGMALPLRFAKLGTVNNVAINKADTLTVSNNKVIYIQYLDVYQPQAPYVANLAYYSYSGTGVRFNTPLPKSMTRRNGISSHGGRVGNYYSALDVWIGVGNSFVWWQGIVSRLGLNSNWANKNSPTSEERAEAISKMEDYFATQEANGTPFQVLYELPKPIEYDLTATDLGQQLLNLIQHNGTTIITVTNDKNLTQTVAAKYLTHA